MVRTRSQLAAACMVAACSMPHSALGFATLPSSRSLSLGGTRGAAWSTTASSTALPLRRERVARKIATTAQMEIFQAAADAFQVMPHAC